MNTRDRTLACLVAVLWGVNFLAIRATLDHLPPLFSAGLRFLVLAVPVVLLVPRPAVPLRWLLLYGAGFGVAQFAFLYLALTMGMPTGLASLVLQSSAPFTVLLGTVLLRERLRARAVAGTLVAVAGMTFIAWERAHAAALLPVLLTLCGGLGWAFGNLGSRLAAPTNPLRLTLWMTVVPVVPLLGMSAMLEGPGTGWRALGATFSAQGWPALAGLAYTVVLATVVGSGLWTHLLARNPAGVVAPFSLLVPVVGIASAWIVLGEVPGVGSVVGGLIVVSGVLLGATGGARRPGSVAVPAAGLVRQAPVAVPAAGLDTPPVLPRLLPKPA